MANRTRSNTLKLAGFIESIINQGFIESISSTLTRKLDRVIIVNIGPPTRLLKSFHKSRSRPGTNYRYTKNRYFYLKNANTNY